MVQRRQALDMSTMEGQSQNMTRLDERVDLPWKVDYHRVIWAYQDVKMSKRKGCKSKHDEGG